MRALACILAALSLAQSANAAITKLICTIEANRGNARYSKSDWVFDVDFDRRTLNDKPAFFGEDHIRQVVPISGENATFLINRITGAITIDSPALGRIGDGACQVAGDKKF